MIAVLKPPQMTSWMVIRVGRYRFLNPAVIDVCERTDNRCEDVTWTRM